MLKRISMDKICYSLIVFKFWYKDKIRIVTIQAHIQGT